MKFHLLQLLQKLLIHPIVIRLPHQLLIHRLQLVFRGRSRPRVHPPNFIKTEYLVHVFCREDPIVRSVEVEQECFQRRRQLRGRLATSIWLTVGKWAPVEPMEKLDVEQTAQETRSISKWKLVQLLSKRRVGQYQPE